jgi:serine/threonine protein kinase
MSEKMKTLTSKRSLDKFKRLAKLGEGTYGVVFKVIDSDSKEVLALKKIRFDDENEGIPSTAVREVALLKELHHPNIVELINVTFHRSQLFLIFEYLQYDLKKFMDKHKRKLPPATVKSFVYQMLQGVDYCHSLRILHRDLKPQNVLVDERGIVKLADFGLARAFGLPARNWTREVITLWYRPPEILLGAANYSVEVDLWSLGCIFAEMVNGRPLFHGDSQIFQLMHIFRTVGTPTSDLWPGASTLKYFQSEFPKWKPRKWDELLPKLDDAGRSLIANLLVLDPSQRFCAKQALKHPYFADFSLT